MHTEQCSFCGNAKPQVEILVAIGIARQTPAVAICNYCARLADELLNRPEEKFEDPSEGRRWRWFMLSGRAYRWRLFPHSDKSVRFLVVCRSGDGTLFGSFVPADTVITTEVVAKAIQEMSRISRRN